MLFVFETKYNVEKKGNPMKENVYGRLRPIKAHDVLRYANGKMFLVLSVCHASEGVCRILVCTRENRLKWEWISSDWPEIFLL